MFNNNIIYHLHGSASLGVSLGDVGGAKGNALQPPRCFSWTAQRLSRQGRLLINFVLVNVIVIQQKLVVKRKG